VRAQQPFAFAINQFGVQARDLRIGQTDVVLRRTPNADLVAISKLPGLDRVTQRRIEQMKR
jgi:hypothetical protein